MHRAGFYCQVYVANVNGAGAYGDVGDDDEDDEDFEEKKGNLLCFIHFSTSILIV